MQNTEQMIITAGIYFLTGLSLSVCYNYLKPRPTKKWQVDGVPIIPAYPHLNASMDALVVAPKLVRWFAKLDKTQIEVRSITVTDINWFSAKPDPKKLGFVKFNIIALDKSTGKQIASNVVFLRGDSVAILIVVSVMSGNLSRQYALLCDQMRVASGGRRSEICAGMMDDDGNIMSVVLKEVKEETGFDIKNKRELKELGSIFPSPGACDEEIFLYSWETTISHEEFKEKQRRVFGDATEGEEIKLSFVPMEDLNLMDMKDVKAECAFRRYVASK
jgi:ADP-sugar diphosphatase